MAKFNLDRHKGKVSDIQQNIKLYYNICSNQDYLRESIKES